MTETVLTPLGLVVSSRPLPPEAKLTPCVKEAFGCRNGGANGSPNFKAAVHKPQFNQELYLSSHIIDPELSEEKIVGNPLQEIRFGTDQA